MARRRSIVDRVSADQARNASLQVRRTAWALFAFFTFLYALLSSGRARTPDEYMTMFEAQSLVERGEATVPQALVFQNFYGRYDAEGKPRAPYPPGQALLTAPSIYIAEQWLGDLGVRSRNDAEDAAPEGREVRLYLAGYGAAITSAAFAGAAMAFFFLIAANLGVSSRAAAITSLCVGLGTLIFPYSGYYFSEPLASLLLLAACYLALVRIRPSDADALWPAAVAGVLLGYAVWVRPTFVFWSAFVCIACLLDTREPEMGRRWRNAMICGGIATVFVIAMLARNADLFGSPLDFGYPKLAENGRELNTFHTPLGVGLVGLLFSPGKSVFLFAPLLVPALFGLKRLWERNRALAFVAIASSVFYLFFYAKYTQWEGGYSLGPRYLIPYVLLLCLALPLLLKVARARLAIYLCTAVGVVSNLVGSSTSFLEDQIGGHGYYDQHWAYRMSYDPMVSQTRLLFEYLRGKPAPLGYGIDRWWVFLHKGGVSDWLLAAMAVVLIAGLAGSMLMLRKSALWQEPL